DIMDHVPLIPPVPHPFFNGINSGVAPDHCPAALSDEDTAEVEEEDSTSEFP
ncbi:hypothetical protein J6590_095648, partial [Homalodisca vitripennis]